MTEIGQAARAFAGSAVAVGIAGAVALTTGQPWLFPSLGPAILLHLEKPRAPESSPRNTLIGHAVALVAGYLMLMAFGLTDNSSVLDEGMTGLRIAAAAGSLAATALALVLLRAPHPPAGATTLIVSLGLLHQPRQLAIAAAAVALVTAIDWLITRVSGNPMPIWRSADE
jgi:hypothetical protein